MRSRKYHPIALSPVAALTLLALGLGGCGGNGSEDPGPIDAGTGSPDLGQPDSGGSTDAGSGADAGTTDARSSLDAGYYCTTGGSETVEGQSVPVPSASDRPTGGSGTVSTRCIDDRVTPFTTMRSLCMTQCLDFLGFQPTRAQVQELEIDVFRAETSDGSRVDPSYDFATLRERSPSERLAVQAQILPTQAPQCPSGYQVEIGYVDQGGSDLASETRYVFRVRSRAASNPTWVTLYIWDFIRRLDAANQIGAECGNPDGRFPERAFPFPALAASSLEQALQATSTSVTGSSNLFDGRGLGYALIETRDCGTFGSLTANLTVGMAPAPSGGAYVDAMGQALISANDTDARGLYLGLGLGTATSSAASEVRAAVGVNRDGACTEAFGGTRFWVFPDSVTFVRTGRETTIQPVF